MSDALEKIGAKPNNFIFGVAPATGSLTPHQRVAILEAIQHGMNIVNGLHEFLNEDVEFLAASKKMNIRLIDIRRPPKKTLRMFTGLISKVSCPRIAILGTDCAIGKRTTATILTRALNKSGLKAVLVSTGQTGLIQGCRYGVALDAVPSQFCAGELEAEIINAFKFEQPDVIIIEGQGALSHPAFSTSSFILRGSCPDAVILQHAPGRATRCDFDTMKMPTPNTEINLIETFAETKVIGLAINHENMTDSEVGDSIREFELELGIPVTDALSRGSDHLVNMVVSAFPKLAVIVKERVQ